MRDQLERRPAWLVRTKLRRGVGEPHFIFLLRLLLGGLWIFSAVGKIPGRVEFVNSVVARQLLPESLAHAYGSVVPWLELVLGTALLVGLFLTWSSSISMLLVISFTIANAAELGTNVYVVSDSCGCFGSWVTLSTTGAIVVDVAMMVGLGLILLRRGEFLSLDGIRKKRRPGPS